MSAWRSIWIVTNIKQCYVCSHMLFHYSCIPGSLYYCPSLTVTAEAPTSFKKFPSGTTLSAHSEPQQSGHHIFSISTALPYFWLMNFALFFTPSTAYNLTCCQINTSLSSVHYSTLKCFSFLIFFSLSSLGILSTLEMRCMHSKGPSTQHNYFPKFLWWATLWFVWWSLT